MAALKTYSAGLEVFPENVTMLTGMARVQEALGEYDESVKLYKRVLDAESNNIEVTFLFDKVDFSSVSGNCMCCYYLLLRGKT